MSGSAMDQATEALRVLLSMADKKPLAHQSDWDHWVDRARQIIAQASSSSGCTGDCQRTLREFEQNVIDSLHRAGRELVRNGETIAEKFGEREEGRARVHAGVLMIDAAGLQSLNGLLALFSERIAAGKELPLPSDAQPLWSRIYAAVGLAPEQADPVKAVERIEAMAAALGDSRGRDFETSDRSLDDVDESVWED